MQEAEAKVPGLRDLPCAWHMVGHLQGNKAARAVALFDVVQSLDGARLADALNRHAAAASKNLTVLVEVNTSGEATKFGVAAEEAADLVGYAASRPRLVVAGLMTVGPLGAGEAETARAFRALKRLYDDITPTAGPAFTYLSMGMTDDFELAIAEGSNMVRVGRAIFGPR